MQNLNMTDLTKSLAEMQQKLSAQLGNLDEALKPMQTKRSVTVPINGKLATVEVTQANMVHIAIPNATDEDITLLLSKLQ